MSFVRLENLNDFIQPSTSCIKPQEKKSAGVVAKVSDINLTDCLACSGCITSAETVLVQQQNYEELFKVINENKISKVQKQIIVSLSLQSIASLAARYSIPAQEAAERIASFFISIGCDRVYDINLARHLSLIESYREFKARIQSANEPKVPIISSVCPGWICYAEKTNGDLIIPHLSKVKSPQQIMGSILKQSLISDGTVSKNSDIFHVTLMPCFDKKLEASRQDFQISDEFDKSQDVDCVLTPVELEEILKQEGVTLLDLEPRRLDILVETGTEFDTPLTSHMGSVSGGYAANLLLAVASERLGVDEITLRDQLEYTILKNNDFIELNLKHSDDARDEVPYKFAIVNGFRNIQTVVQRLKRSALKYDYIEIMACPSGCINGGAQCKSIEGGSREDSFGMSEKLYKDVPHVKLSIRSEEIRNMLNKQFKLNDEVMIEKAFHTNFHAVSKLKNLTVNW